MENYVFVVFKGYADEEEDNMSLFGVFLSQKEAEKAIEEDHKIPFALSDESPVYCNTHVYSVRRVPINKKL